MGFATPLPLCASNQKKKKPARRRIGGKMRPHRTSGGSGMKVTSNAKVDPALRDLVENATPDSAPVAAVVKLRPKDETQRKLPPEETQRVAETVLERVRQQAGEKEQDYYVLEMLGAFNLVASPHFIANLLNQPEVASAFSAENEESAYIPPQNVKEVHLKVKAGRSHTN